jgi:hypothetical protein
MHVILATLEAEIRRILFTSQVGQRVPKTLSQKYPIQNRASGVAQMAEDLPNEHGALS